MTYHRHFAALILTLLVLTACDGGDAATTTAPPPTTTAAPATTTTAAPTTTTTAAPATTTTAPPPTTTTTTEAPLFASPLNGLGHADPTVFDRRVMAVKIDNAPAGRPQAGLEQAEAVYELPVEGGFTRFIALYHTLDLEYLGPIRSIRPTDSTLVVPLGATIQMSGGQPYVRALIRADGANVLQATGGGATYRIPERKAPLNLFGNTNAMREKADAAGFEDDPPPPLATFGEPAPSDTPVGWVSLDFSDRPPVVWRWNGQQYMRFNGNEQHTWFDQAGNGGPLLFDTLLMLDTKRYTVSPPTKVKDGKTVPDGSPVPAFRTTGEGTARLFYDGYLVEGTWARESIEDPFTFTLDDGTEMVLPPGRLWITLFPTDREMTWG